MLISHSSPKSTMTTSVITRSVRNHSFASVFFVITTISIISCSKSALIDANNVGFSVDLIHRDSPVSPFYQPHSNPSHHMNIGALRRSFNRAKHLNSIFGSKCKNLQTDVIPDQGEFLMKLSVGTPPVEVLAIIDTASDLIWIQCQPCKPCYKQFDPIFDPRTSSTYKLLPCTSNKCRAISQNSCSTNNETCQYHLIYGDGSFSNGDVARETVTLGSKSLKNIVFGCGNRNGGIFSPTGSGIVGLGGGKLSLVYQLRSSIHGKFSHCFIPSSFLNDIATKSSKFHFGGVVSGPGVISTPIIPKQFPNTYYFLSLEGFSIGNKRIDLPKSSTSSEGNIIIDSGTTLTFLPSDFYSKVESTMKNMIGLNTTKDPQGILKLCYISSQLTNVPDVTVHFKGADVKLTKLNTFVETSANSSCFAFWPSENVPIYGNLAQMNFLVGYDLKKKKVSFKPTDCTKQ